MRDFTRNKNSFGQLSRWFLEYVGRYAAVDPDGREAYELKIGHSLRVAKHCAALGRSLNFNEGEIFLAKAIGLFHDIGRFEQFLRYHTFLDGKSENHAELGASVLRGNGALSLFSGDVQELILKVVSCHNRLKLPDGGARREELFCKLIRDADKIDIMGIVSAHYESDGKSDFIELNLPDEQAYSNEIIGDLFNNRLVDMKKMKTLNDFKLLQLGWVYDLNFPLSAQLISEKRYLERIRKSLPRSGEIDELLVRLNCHLEKLGNNAAE